MTYSEFYYEIVSALINMYKSTAANAGKLREIDNKIGSKSYTAKGIAELQHKRGDILQNNRNCKSEAIAKIEKIIQTFRDEMQKPDMLNPAELTADAQLFTLGVPLTCENILEILRRNQENLTIQTLAVNYAEKMGLNESEKEEVIKAAGKYYLQNYEYNNQINTINAVQYGVETILRNPSEADLTDRRFFDYPVEYPRVFTMLFINEDSAIREALSPDESTMEKVYIDMNDY